MLALALLLAATAACQPAKGACETPVSADSVADSVGVNIHLHYGDTVYGNFPLIQTLLTDLGVRHTRDGLIDTTWQPYYQRHAALARQGIKCLFVTSPSQSSALITSWPGRVPGAVEGYEAPNEYDLSGDPRWAATLTAFVRQLYSTVKSDPTTSKFPVVGPSLTQPPSYAQVAGLERYFDFSNMHNYFGGRNPGTPGWGDGGYGSITYNINNNQTAWHGKKIWTTETGYVTDTNIVQGLPELIEGKYAPRMILEQVLHGVTRTYVYELIDQGQAFAGNAGAFGLARMNGSPKPAFTALKNLIATLIDPGPEMLPPNLQFTLVGASSNVHHLLMAKRDGSYYLAFWLEEQDYDVDKRVETPVNPQRLTFVSNRVFKTAQLIVIKADGSLEVTQLKADARIPLIATDHVAILKLPGS
jgi:hypothetical protein